MAEYIEREKIVSIIKADIRQCKEDAEDAFGDEAYLQAVKSRENGVHYILCEIERQPAADVVEVVRCKDCNKAQYKSDSKKTLWCFLHKHGRKFDDFCSFGMRCKTE